VEELLQGDNDVSDSPRKSLGWDYTEKESDIEAHIVEMKEEKKEKYQSMISKEIHNHIYRVEMQKKNNNAGERGKKKKKGLKSKVLKPLLRGLLEIGSRSALVMPSYY
jgi:hypothetical protein